MNMKGNFEIYFFYSKTECNKIIHELNNSTYLSIEEINKDNWIEDTHHILDNEIAGNLFSVILNKNEEIRIDLKFQLNPSVRIYILYSNEYFFVFFGFKEELLGHFADIKKVVNWGIFKKLSTNIISGFELEFDFHRNKEYEELLKRKSNFPVFIKNGNMENIFYNSVNENSLTTAKEMNSFLDYLELTEKVMYQKC